MTPKKRPQARLKLNRVFCLEESVWDDDKGLTDQASVLPTLELLQRMGAVERFVHRHCYGFTEFENYAEGRAPDRTTRSFGTVYFAFHGTREGLRVGEKTLSLDRLAELVGQLPGGVVHLGSCSVLKGDPEAAQRFLSKTGAALLSGYQRDVEWLDSAALDLAWLGYLTDYSRPGDSVRFFRQRYESVISHLNWECVPAGARK